MVKQNKHHKIYSAKQYWEQLILTISGKIIDKHKCINPDGTVYFYELADGVNAVIYNIEPKSSLIEQLVYDYSEAENIDYIISFSQRNVEIMNQANTKYDIAESVGFIIMDKRHRLILNPSILGYDSSVTIYLSKEGIHQLGLQDYLSVLETIDIRFFDTFEDVGLVLMNIMKTFLSDSPIVYPLQQKLTEVLIYMAFEHLYQQEKKVFCFQNYSKDNSRLSQLYQVQSHIYKNITNKPDINFLSMKFKIPKPELENDFLSLSGKTIHAYYQNARLLKAMELLVSKEKNVKEISFYLGFSDVPHFSRSFKKKFKYSPMEYLKRYKL